MKRTVTPLILLLLVSTVNAQDQELQKGNLHRDFPDVQLIRPSIPPWHFNFDLNRWEQDQAMPVVIPTVINHLDIDLRLLYKHSAGAAKRLRHKRTHHHIHRELPGRKN
jgi:hypothetical protein